MPKQFSQSYTLSVGATRVIRCNFTAELDEGASITGTPTVVEQDTDDLTIGSITVTTSTYTDDTNGKTVAAGKALFFTVSGGSSGVTYSVLVTVTTDSTPAEVIPRLVKFSWE